MPHRPFLIGERVLDRQRAILRQRLPFPLRDPPRDLGRIAHPERGRTLGMERAALAHDRIEREVAGRVEPRLQLLDAGDPIEPEDPDLIGAVAVGDGVPHPAREDDPIRADDSEPTASRPPPCDSGAGPCGADGSASRSRRRCSRSPAAERRGVPEVARDLLVGQLGDNLLQPIASGSIARCSSGGRSALSIARPSSSAHSSPLVSRIGRRKWLGTMEMVSASMKIWRPSTNPPGTSNRSVMDSRS